MTASLRIAPSAHRRDGGAEEHVLAAASLAGAIAADAAEAESSGYPLRSIERLAASGLLAAPLPGDGTGPASGLAHRRHRSALLRVLAHVGRGSLPVGRLYEGHVNALILVAAFGTPTQRMAAARAAAEGSLFAVWNTEPASDGARLVSAGPGGRLALAGRKSFASGAGHAGMAIVTASDSDGHRHMVLVDLRRATLRIDPDSWRPLGMKPTSSHTVVLDGIAVRDDDLLGGPGDYLRQPLFGTGAVRFCAVQIGGIEGLLDATRQFLRSENRAEDALQRVRLGEMAMRTLGASLWLDAAARNAEDLVDDETAISFAHLMRAAVVDAGFSVLQLAARAVGARGLLEPQPFGRMHRDLVHYLGQAAPDAAAIAAGAHVLSREGPACGLWQSASS